MTAQNFHQNSKISILKDNLCHHKTHTAIVDLDYHNKWLW